MKDKIVSVSVLIPASKFCRLFKISDFPCNAGSDQHVKASHDRSTKMLTTLSVNIHSDYIFDETWLFMLNFIFSHGACI